MMKSLYESLKIGNLIGKYLIGKETKEEADELKKLLEQQEDGKDLFNTISDEENIINSIEEFERYDIDEGWAIFNKSLSKQLKKERFFRLKVAASILIIITFSFLALHHFSGNRIDADVIIPSGVISSGESRAFIEFSNGAKFDLENLNGQQRQKLAQMAGIVVEGNVVKNLKTKYHLKNAPKIVTLVVPRGKEYQLVLSDGTKVWLNAETRFEYPVKFLANNRTVKLTGEAYFSVTKDRKRPFVVSTQEIDIEVLGTEFNVSAYNDDNIIQTTLVEGKVLIKNNNNPALKDQTLLPGEQLNYNKNNNTAELNKVDAYEYIAWKDGRFVFEHRTLEEITKILGRWYDVDFVFKSNDIINSHYSGEFLRYEDISTVVKILNMTDDQIEYRLLNETIEISKK